MPYTTFNSSCYKCGVNLNESNWSNYYRLNADLPEELRHRCKECERQRRLKRYIDNREIILQKAKEWRITNAESYQKSLHQHIPYLRKYYNDKKREVLSHYSPNMICVVCGESNLNVLTIDHINGGGGKHLKSIGGNIYYWLRRNNYPSGYQVLCMNCNWLRRESIKVQSTRSKWRRQITLGVINHYTNGSMRCNNCGISNLKALTIDHINGNGLRHRIEHNIGGHIAEWLRQNNYPEGYQVLCMNCQFIKRKTNNETGGRKCHM